ncbi:histidine kinase dimerization/phosphoacceptor domain -containing protein [Spirosoma sp. KNUC1025]|uniref:tetratricopeptide repeat-containing sensor histidine kinase n=1 Tax=Spirosoma sp. KNUC1025 TaxID=2894082 RepID=UPI00386AF29D|nr:sensor histidine kinase [Spirosoma sp. KNUC1025]
MRFAKQRNPGYPFVVGIVVLTVGALSSLPAFSQTPSAGKYLYDKLLKTEQEYRKALATGDSMEVAEICYRMGKRYAGIGDFMTANKWFIRSLRIRERHGPSEGIGKAYLRMAEIEVTQKHYKQALTYTRRAIMNFRHVQSDHGMMSAYNVLGGVYELGWRINQEKPGSLPAVSFDSVSYYFRQAVRLALLLKKPADIANTYMLMGASLAVKNAEMAIGYLEKAYAINIQEKSPYGIINTSQKLADCYLTLGQTRLAKKWLEAAQFICDTARSGDYWQNSDREGIYVKYYQQTGDWKQAFEHQNRQHALQLEAINADREIAMARAGLLYETEKKETQLQAQQKTLVLRQKTLDAERQLSLMTTVLFVLAGISSTVFYWLFRKHKWLSEHNARLVKEQNHRVKNNLQSITNLLGLQFNRLTDPAAREAVEESLLRVEAMALVHQRLYDGDRLVEVELSQFVPELVSGVLRSYSFGHVQPNYTLSTIWLQADTAINLGLLLNELVTNSCKYAFLNNPNPSLEIVCRQLNSWIEIGYKDNGPGFNPTVKGNSFGMKLIDIITEKLNGKSSFNADNGFYFRLSFDCRSVHAANASLLPTY